MPTEIIKNMKKSARVGLTTLALGATAGGAQAEESPMVTQVPGKPALMLSMYDLAPLGYSTEEFFVSGTATSYKVDGKATEDGQWTVETADTAPYTTRIVVLRPADPKKFNGTVLVEWLNVTAGADGAPDWTMTHREIMRSGYAYVGVSAQKVGVEGTDNPGPMTMAQPLKKTDPERYGTLHHPGDAYSFDIYSQAGRLVKDEADKILGPLKPKHVLAIGESQSAARLVTYINAVDPSAKVYDGFLVHSRFGGGAPLQGEGMGNRDDWPRFIQFRPDLRVPVLAVETETDLLGGNLSGYHGARIPDNQKLRVWEVPGTAHADNYSFVVGHMDSGQLPIDKLAAAWAPMAKLGPTSPFAKPINNAPQHHYVVQAAMANLDRWIRTGKAPSKAEPMQLKDSKDDAPPSLITDANGLTEGGVRTPWVDAPIARTSGTGNSGNGLAFLVGLSEPFDQATLDRLYPGGKDDYLKKFEKSLNKAVKAGFLLAADKQEILDLAAATYPASQ